jgi:hypothetical protein
MASSKDLLTVRLKCEEDSWPPLTHGALVAEMNAFYANPKNLRLPLHGAVNYICLAMIEG